MGESQRTPKLLDPYLRPYSLTQSNQIWLCKKVGRGVFPGVNHAFNHMGWAQGSHILGPPTWAHTLSESLAKFCMVIKLEERKNFTGSITSPALTIIFVTRMLTRDSFAVANLVYLLNKLRKSSQVNDVPRTKTDQSLMPVS